jgi:hypothetical protein
LIAPEDILFIFSQSIEAISYFPFIEPEGDSQVKKFMDPLDHFGYKNGGKKYSPKSKYSAVIMCYCDDTKPLAYLCGQEQDGSANEKQCYQALFTELEGIKNSFKQLHVSDPYFEKEGE